MPWTTAQQLAIELRDCDLLVSAGAGAGKTAVLTERVLQRITVDEPPLDIDRLLIVTFTEAAAAEMRGRIDRRLRELLAASPGDERLQRQLALLPGADISTIDAFCLRLLRRQFHLTDLDPGFQVLDENEAQLLRLEVVTNLLERRFAQEPEDSAFLDLVARYGGRRGEHMAGVILRLHRFIATLVDREAWWQTALAVFSTASADEHGENLEHSPAFLEVRRGAQKQVESAQWQLEHAVELASLPDGPASYVTTLTDDLQIIQKIRSALASSPWDEVAELIQGVTFRSLNPVRGDAVDPFLRDLVKDLREQVKKAVAQLARGPIGMTLARHRRQLASLAPAMLELRALVEDFEAAYRQSKDALGVVDFNDLERHSLALLEAGADPGPYAEIIIDEYQDINPLQDALLTRLAQRCTRFMVGDVKQSIYRFRLADPTIFLTRQQRYPATPGGAERRIDLPDNFRSRPTVLAAVNHVFRQLFATEVGEVGYDASAELRPGLAYPDPQPPVVVHLLERERSQLRAAATQLRAGDPTLKTGEHLRSDEREAVLVARIIRELLGMDGNVPESVWPSPDNRRPLQPGDIAVLLRAPRDRAATFVEIFAEHGIPARADLRTGYFDALEVATMLSLLQVIDNEQQDIPLAAVLHSPLVGLSTVDLARIRLVDRDGSFRAACRAATALADHGSPFAEIADFFTRLDRWRRLARLRPLGDLVWQLLQETGYLDYAGGMPGGEQRRANLKHLLELARNFDRFSRHGLRRFLKFVEQLRAEQGDLGAVTPAGSSQDAVQVLSIHGSKGLEFPVVFVVDLGRDFNFKELDDSILVHRALGIGPRGIDPLLGIKYETVAQQALRRRIRAEAIAEEMRVLYVAMTRARERLYLIGSATDMSKQARRWASLLQHEPIGLPDAYLLDASGPLDLLGPCLARHRHGQPLRAAAELPLLPANRDLHDDPSSWRVRVWSATEAVKLARTAGGGGGALAEHWHTLAAGEVPPLSALSTDDLEVVAATIDDLSRRLDWQLPLSTLGERPAKASVTELKRRVAPAAGDVPADDEQQALPATDEEPAVDWSGAQPAVWHPREPSFAAPEAAGRDRLDPMERGSAVHLVLQHLDLSRPLTAADLTEQIERMVERNVLSTAQARAIDTGSLAEFFAGDLGRRIRRAENRRREVPFTFRLPAAEAYPELPPDSDEWVLVQGIVDLLFWEGKRLVLVDYKTDAVAGPAVSQRVGRYRRQIEFYVRAMQAVFRQPVAEAYLAFVIPGLAVPVVLNE